jgi:hypothetical protein
MRATHSQWQHPLRLPRIVRLPRRVRFGLATLARQGLLDPRQEPRSKPLPTHTWSVGVRRACFYKSPDS